MQLLARPAVESGPAGSEQPCGHCPVTACVQVTCCSIDQHWSSVSKLRYVFQHARPSSQDTHILSQQSHQLVVDNRPDAILVSAQCRPSAVNVLHVSKIQLDSIVCRFKKPLSNKRACSVVLLEKLMKKNAAVAHEHAQMYHPVEPFLCR